MQSQDMSSPEVEIIIDSDDDNLFQMDDLLPSPSEHEDERDKNYNANETPKIRYYKPTNETPSGLSSSVVINDTDHLRRSIMKMKIQSIMEKPGQAQSLEGITEETDNYYNHGESNTNEDNESISYINNDDNECEYEGYMTIIPNNHHQRSSLYSHSAPPNPSYFPYLSKRLFSSSAVYSPSSQSPENASPSFPAYINHTLDQQQQDERNSDVHSDSREHGSDDDESANKEHVDANNEILPVAEGEATSSNEQNCKALTTSSPLHTTSNTSSPHLDKTEGIIVSSFNEAMSVNGRKSYLVMNKYHWDYYNNIALSNNSNYYYPTLQYQNNVVQQNHVVRQNHLIQQNRSNTEIITKSSFRTWNRLASAHYKESSTISLQHQQRILEIYCNHHSRSLWERMHYDRDSYERLISNPFIVKLMAENACSIKVTGISANTRFRDIQRHFYSSHVVSMRYFRSLQCAYIMYRSYEEMMRASSTFDKTRIGKDVIYCRPSFHGELDKDDMKQTRLLCKDQKSRLKDSRKDSEIHDTYIPEHHGIIQNSYYSSTFAKSKKKRVKSRELEYRRVPCANAQHKYLLNHAIPEIQEHTFITNQYIMVKPWLKTDIECSQDIGYWSFNPRNMAALNHLFNTTPSVVLIFSLKGSRAYQGYAIMKSEIIDLNTTTDEELFSVYPFNQYGRAFQTDPSGRYWRYCCKVDWVMIQRRSYRSTCNISNSWNRDHPIRYSKDCTIIEPNLGQRILEEFSPAFY